MHKKISLLFILFNCLLLAQADNIVYETDSVLINNAVQFQNNASPDIAEITLPKWYEPVTNVPLNMYRVVGNSFTTNNLPVLGYISALTTVLVLTDAQTHSSIQSVFRNNSSLKNYPRYTVYLGDGKINLGIAGLFSLYGLTFSDDRALRTGMQCFGAIIGNGIFVQLLKRITGRESPLTASSKSGTWRFFPNIIKYQKDQPKYYSFPSGHLSTAIATITVIADNYPESSYIKPVGYSMAGLLALGLVSKDMHWLSDFPLAVAIGYEFGKIITSQNNVTGEGKESSGNLNLSIMPIFLSRGGGIDMLISF